MEFIDFESFLKVDMRVGKVVKAEIRKDSIKPAIKLWIEFGGEIGLKKSSAQITEAYSPENLLGEKVVAVVNLKPRQIGSFMSEVLVLGAQSSDGISLLQIQDGVRVGERIH